MSWSWIVSFGHGRIQNSAVALNLIFMKLTCFRSIQGSGTSDERDSSIIGYICWYFHEVLCSHWSFSCLFESNFEIIEIPLSKSLRRCRHPHAFAIPKLPFLMECKLLSRLFLPLLEGIDLPLISCNHLKFPRVLKDELHKLQSFLFVAAEVFDFVSPRTDVVVRVNYRWICLRIFNLIDSRLF